MQLTKLDLRSLSLADDLIDLGTTEIFPIDINWAEQITPDIGLTKIIHQYKGTATHIEDYIDVLPIMAGFNITLFEPADIYSFLDFFDRTKGRAYKFWLKLPWHFATLKGDIPAGSTTIPVYRNQLQNVTENNERIWIEMKTGDIITRKIASITDDITGDKHVLNINTITDRDITTDNHWSIARLLLCRFVSDSIRLSLESDQAISVSCSVIETVKEYNDV